MVNKTVEETAFDAEATYPSNAVMRGTTVTTATASCGWSASEMRPKSGK